MSNTAVTCLLIYAFIIFNTRWRSCYGNSPNNSTLRCKPSERAALLNFKHNLTYFDERVSSTGHVLELDLSGDYHSGDTTNLLKMVKLESLVYLLELKQLERLYLIFNDFNYSSIPKFMGMMKQLRYLDLSYASFSGLIPHELGNLTNLESLGLSNNMLLGEIPASLGKLSNLKELDLSANNLSSIASSLRFPSNMKTLDLCYNQLSGNIQTSIGKLSKLRALDIRSNPLEGTVLSEPHFANLSSLTYLYMEDTMLTFSLSSSNWVPPFQLKEFYADTCKINGQLTPWLQIQKSLSVLSLSNANISGLMPSWFHITTQHYEYVDLSNNNLIGSPIFPINFAIINLSSNSLSGKVLSIDSKTEVY